MLLTYSDVSSLSLLAEICRRTNRHQEAIKYYRKVIQQDKNNFTAYQNLAQMQDPSIPAQSCIMYPIVQAIIYIHKKQLFRQAIALLQTLPFSLTRFVKMHSTYSSVMVRLMVARCYYEMADYTSACEQYQEIQRLEPWCMEGMARLSI